jgi:integrase
VEKEKSMAIYKRGKTYWFNFWWRGQHIHRSTKQGNPRVARQMEAAYRTALAKGEVGLAERKPAPPLKVFAQQFMDAIAVRCNSKAKTVEFYAQQTKRLLDFEPLANARLSDIDEFLIERFVQQRSQQVSAATVNRGLATLRRALRLAHEWKLVDRMPRVRLLPGEQHREYVLTYEDEQLYFESAPQPLKDIAVLLVDAGVRIGEALALERRNVHLRPAPGAAFGYLHVRDGKSRNARRNVSLTARATEILVARKQKSCSTYVFGEGDGRPMLVSSLDHLHRLVRELLSFHSWASLNALLSVANPRFTVAALTC